MNHTSSIECARGIEGSAGVRALRNVKHTERISLPILVLHLVLQSFLFIPLEKVQKNTTAVDLTGIKLQSVD